MNSRSLAAIASTFALFLAITGCSSNPAFPKIKGQVLLDTKPVSEARVTFQGPAGGNVAVTNEEGKFEFDGSGPYKTLKPGKYIVLVTKVVDKKTGQVPAPEEYEQLVASNMGKSVIPYIYTERETSPLNVDIVEGPNDLKPFELKSK